MSLTLFSNFISSSTQIGAGVVFKKLSDTVLTGATGTITSDTFTAPTFMQILFYFGNPTGAAAVQMRFNGDSGNKYGWRRHTNNIVTSNSNQTSINASGASTKPGILECSVTNLAATNTVLTGLSARGANDAVPDQTFFSGTWDETDQITSVTMLTTANNFPIGTRLIVLGL